MPVDHSHNLIEVSHLSFFYGDNAVLKDISLDIHQGDYLGIIGPNGGGKTTLVKLILGLLPPASGTISIFGRPLSQFSDWSKIGYVAQKATHIDPKFPITVEEVVALGRVAHAGLFHSLSPQDFRAVNRALDHAQLADLKHRLIGHLSGGQQQRVFIARALAQEPEVIFLDEPTSGVDQASQEQFYKLLKKLNQELDITLILISHDIDVVTNEVTEVACINQTLVYHGSTQGFIKEEKLNSLYTKGFKFVVHAHNL